MRKLTDRERKAYAEDGVVHLREAFDASWVEALREHAEDALNAPGRLGRNLSADDDPGRFFSETFLWHRHAGFKDFVHSSPAAELVADLWGAAGINIIFDQLLIKEPGTREPTVWHHDLTYWPVRGEQVATLWLALDEVTAETGAMEFVCGSHRWGQRYHPIAFAGHSTYDTDEPEVPDIDALRDELDFVQYDYAPGDCTIHHGMLVHYAGGNQSASQRRRAYVTRWAGDGVVYDPRPNIQRMLFEPDLEPAAPLTSRLWPQVWPRS
ncbi:MAG: phytanoyl-CoA dioxygenase family protein [Pseudomonadota bacterium]